MRQARAEVVGRLAAPAGQAEGLGQLHEVGVGEVDAEVLAELLVLLPDDGAELAVLPDHVDDRGAQADGGLELLVVHQEAAVAGDRDHVAIGVHDLGRDGGRQGEAHAGQAVGDQHRVGLVRGEHAPDPQLVQAHVGDEDVLAAERLADLVQRARGLDREVVVVLGRVEAAVHHIAQPRRTALVGHVPALLGQARERVVDVADQLDLGHEVLVNLGRQRVDADDLLVPARVPVLGRVLDQVVADGQHHVRLVEAGHGVVAGLEPNGAERLGRVHRDQALAHERLGHRDAGGAHELAQRGGGAGPRIDAVACQRHRVEGAADHVRGLEQLTRLRLGLGGAPARQRAGVQLGLHDVLGQLDVGRRRASRPRRS